MKKMLALTLVACAALSAAAAAQTAAARPDATTSLTVYSGREERLVKPLFDRFTKDTGIALNVRYGSSAEMAATILEEGRNSRADVFFAQEAGLLGFVARDSMLKVLPQRTLDKVPARFRAPGKRWVGTSGRARVIAYNTNELTKAQLPQLDLGADEAAMEWQGRTAPHERVLPGLRRGDASQARRGPDPRLVARPEGERGALLREQHAGRSGGRS